MAKTTRFYDSQTGQDGPVSGAIQLMNLSLETDPGASATKTLELRLPAGMAFEITDIVVECGAVTGSPTIQVGSTSGGAEVVASVALATGTNTLTLVEGTIAAAGLISVTIATGAGEAIALPVSVNVVGYVTAPPSSAP